MQWSSEKKKKKQQNSKQFPLMFQFKIIKILLFVSQGYLLFQLNFLINFFFLFLSPSHSLQISRQFWNVYVLDSDLKNIVIIFYQLQLTIKPYNLMSFKTLLPETRSWIIITIHYIHAWFIKKKKRFMTWP